MLTRCGMLSRALWSRSRASCLLGRSSRRHPNQASFTRPRNNHVALEGYRLTGESKSANPGDPRFPSTHRASNLVLQGSLGGESPAAFRGKVAPSPTCSTWNTWAAGPEGGATRLPLIGRGSPGARRFRSIRLAAHASLTRRTGLRAQPAIGFAGRGERSYPSTSPPIPERHPRRCSRDSRRATRRRRRSLRSGVPRRPLHPWRQGSLAGSLGELDLSEAWLAPARGYLRKRSPGRLSSNRMPGRGERSYPSMSLAELRLRSRLRDSAALSMRPARCRNGAV